MNYFVFLLLVYLLPKNNNPEQSVTASQLKEWVSFLSSDEMRGRRNGSPEMQSAAGWIAGEFSEMGLKPVESLGDYVQNYTFLSRQNEVKERNIIGYLEGSDPSLRNEFIILSAHFDHVGVGKGNQPDSIYNGADDNASGTVTLIGIAKAIKDSGIKPGRSLIFAAFSGEESGMRGSRYFVANSPIPLKKVFADLNFEMTGHSEYLGKNRYYMTGCSNSNLDNLIGEYNKNTEFQLIDTISLANNLFYASDNLAFSRISSANGITRGIPSGTFATTTMASYIHSPSDEVALFDFDNMASLVNHFSSLVLWLSNNKTEINWTDTRFVRPE
jgi:Zn-dependent M28 family amino/carboxypeptidase